jgi:excisionase family DNA binding protein
VDAAHNEKGQIERLAYRPYEVAKAIGCSRAYAYWLVKTGRLRSVREGRAIFVPREAVQELLADRDGDTA